MRNHGEVSMVFELPQLWNELWLQGFPGLRPLVWQCVNRKLYQSQHISVARDQISADVSQLTTDEETIFRYAAGYVPFKLLKYEKGISEFAIAVVECLSAMVVNSEEFMLLEYTRNCTMDRRIT